MRYTPQGVAVTDFSVAANGPQKDGEAPTWFKVTAWRQQAENCVKYLTKGSQVYVEGPLEVETWADKEGVARFTLCVSAQTVQFLGGISVADEEAQEQEEMPSPKMTGKADIPF